MTSFKNKTILVTGGASGIGYLLGEKSLLREARHLVIWDIDEDQLFVSASQLSAQGFSISTNRVDVSNADQVQDTAKEVLEEFGKVDILFNNAGVVVGKSFHQHTTEDIDRTIDINTKGLMYVARAFLPAMLESNSGHIVNITSAAGLTPNPGMTVYAASKWAAVGWAESLRLEVATTHPGVKFLNVMPSYIDTGMFEGVKAPRLTPLLDPDVITTKIIQHVEKEKIHLKAPFMVKTTLFFRGILPTRLYDFIAGKVFKVYESMETFKGRVNE
ncbi:MAG: SDR family oxidoreductase [Balneolaceae bacterium]|nr:SDR family oxidoreductase [Balneolaceae bacterium]MBO6545502.1 SDR family oxidoreductase [Balneolaceae bacterium]MBO6646898.1 SDR family oxidoreductase [Balneolaceae bacterium]